MSATRAPDRTPATATLEPAPQPESASSPMTFTEPGLPQPTAPQLSSPQVIYVYPNGASQDPRFGVQRPGAYRTQPQLPGISSRVAPYQNVPGLPPTGGFSPGIGNGYPPGDPRYRP